MTKHNLPPLPKGRGKGEGKADKAELSSGLALGFKTNPPRRKMIEKIILIWISACIVVCCFNYLLRKGSGERERYEP